MMATGWCVERELLLLKKRCIEKGGKGWPLDCIHGLHITGLSAWGTCVLLTCTGLGRFYDEWNWKEIDHRILI